MVRKYFAGAAVVSLLTLGTPLSVRSVYAQSPSETQSPANNSQEQKSTKSVSGKITDIGNGGHSFHLQVSGENKNTMEFVVDKNTQVNGQVREGTLVTVEYQPTGDGKNVAVNITASA
jgi:hypothetical protein